MAPDAGSRLRMARMARWPYGGSALGWRTRQGPRPRLPSYGQDKAPRASQCCRLNTHLALEAPTGYFTLGFRYFNGLIFPRYFHLSLVGSTRDLLCALRCLAADRASTQSSRLGCAQWRPRRSCCVHSLLSHRFARDGPRYDDPWQVGTALPLWPVGLLL